MSVGAALLAISVGVFAFLPVIVELARHRSASADAALSRAQRAYFAFDALLTSVILLGATVLIGVLLLYAPSHWLYFAQIATLVTGVSSLLVGTMILGWTLRGVRETT